MTLNMMSMKSEIKISVLIPIYGVEKYIERCARSLFEQTMRDGIEFVFVNDCTLDRSMEILKRTLGEYPDRMSQVSIINHEENKGLAVARVTGVNVAKGEYVIHCDSDDWVEPNMYELMYLEAKRTNVDIVGCDFIDEYASKSVIRKQDFNLPQVVLVNNMLAGFLVAGYLWNRMIRREFYMKGHYEAPPDITFMEDMIITLPMHVQTNKVAYVNQALYHYNRMNENSMVTECSMNHIISGIKVSKYLKQFLASRNEYHQSLRKFDFYQNIPLIIQLANYKPKLWLDLYKDNFDDLGISVRSQISAILVRKRLFVLNKLLQWLINFLFKR